MSIISHETIISSHAQANGEIGIYHVFIDHNGISHKRAARRVSGILTSADYLAERLSLVSIVEQELNDEEEDNLVSEIEQGNDVLAFVLSPTHSTSKLLAKKLIRHMMRERDPRLVIALEPLIVYLRANYTNDQLINFLDITTNQSIKMNTRINAILDNKVAVFDTFDTNSEDII